MVNFSSQDFENIVRPPFRGLTLAVWVYFVLCFVLHPGSAIMQGHFVDADDTLYLTQSMAWLDGQGWYDRTEHRMDPPAGSVIHFSRFAEMPQAALMSVARIFTDKQSATVFAAAILPPLFLFGIFCVWRWQAKSLMPENWVALTAGVGIFAQQLIFQFMPGRVDHHGLVALLVALSVGCVFKLFQEGNWRWAAGAAVLLAFSTMIALETLPWLLLIALFIGFWSLVKGHKAAEHALIFGKVLCASSFVFLMTYVPPKAWFKLETVTFSFTYVLMMAAMVLCFGMAWLVRKQKMMEFRFLTGGTFAFAMGALFLSVFPDLMAGPYGGVDPELANFMLSNITEAQPYAERFSFWQFITYVLAWPMAAFVVCVWQIKRGHKDLRWVWGLQAFLIAGATLLASFYESRLGIEMQMFCVLPLTYFLYQKFSMMNDRESIIPRKIRIAGWVLLLPLPLILMPAFVYGSSLKDIAMFPMMAYAPECNTREAAKVLSEAPYYKGKSKLILNSIEEGPDLLLNTPHNILSAPYHTNVKGNLDAAKFFRTTDPKVAERIARKRRVDYVLSCRYISQAYLAEDLSKKDFDSKGRFRMKLDLSFALQLGRNQVPAWLEPIKALEAEPVIIYRVVSKHEDE